MIDYEISFYTQKTEFKIEHENIIKCLGHYEDAKFHYIVLEFCQSDLQKQIKTHARLDETKTQALFR